jgi:hypothetical protein
MKAQVSLASLSLLLYAGLPAQAQEAGTINPVYALTKPATAPSDRRTTEDADKTRQKIAASLSDNLVIFSSSHDAQSQRLGVPLTAFADSPFRLAYDPAGRQVMAQWTPGSLGRSGQGLQYRAYMDAAGSLGFVLSAGF